MKKTDFIKHIFLFAICFFFANIFAVFIYAQVYTYILRAFGMGEYAGHIAYIVGLLVSHFHMMYIFIYGNSSVRSNFFEGKRKIFLSPYFGVGNAVFFAMTLVFAPNFAFFHITSAIFPGKALSVISKKFIISFVMLFVDFVLFFLANIAAYAKWGAESEESDVSRGAGAIFLRVLVAFLFYLFLLGVVIRFTVTMFFYTGFFFQVLLFFVPALLIFFAFFALLSYVKRKRFKSKIKVLCEKYGFSFVGRRHGVISVVAHGKSYAIKLFGAKKIILNFYFWFSRNKFLKKFLNRIFRKFAFGAENGEMKIFVLIPIFGKAQTRRFIENGERIDEYRIFYSTPFLRALENDFLER